MVVKLALTVLSSTRYATLNATQDTGSKVILNQLAKLQTKEVYGTYLHLVVYVSKYRKLNII